MSTFGDGGDDDVQGTSVIPVARGRLLTKIFVADAVDVFVSTGFRGDDSVPDASDTSQPRRLPDDLNADWT